MRIRRGTARKIITDTPQKKERIKERKTALIRCLSLYTETARKSAFPRGVFKQTGYPRIVTGKDTPNRTMPSAANGTRFF